MELNPYRIRGEYHYITTITRTLITEHDHISWHNSIMVISKTRFKTTEELSKAVIAKIKIGDANPMDIVRIISKEGTWIVDGGFTIDDARTLDWCQSECSYIPFRM